MLGALTSLRRDKKDVNQQFTYPFIKIFCFVAKKIDFFFLEKGKDKVATFNKKPDLVVFFFHV